MAAVVPARRPASRLAVAALVAGLCLGTAACGGHPGAVPTGQQVDAGAPSGAVPSDVTLSGPAASPDPAAASGTTAPGTPGGTASAAKAAARTPAGTRPAASATTRRAPASAAPGTGTVRSARKGATLWSFDGAAAAVADSGAGWYYTWSPSGVAGVRATFVPMIWGASSVTASALAAAKGAGTVLAFNEPDLGGQANLSVETALALWPQLQATGARLISPAVAYGGATAGGWLDRFMTGTRAKGYRVDAIALHWYGGDFSAPAATAQLKQYLTAVHDRYGKPVWLTEFALMRFGPTVTPTAAQQAAFVTSATAMLESLPWVERYAWFSFPTPKEGGLGTGLYSPGGTATAMGRAYRRAGPP